MRDVRITIDPGTAGAAFSIWDDVEWNKLCCPIYTELMNSVGSWDASAKAMYSRINDIVELDDYNVTHIYCEYPAYFDSAKGNMSAGEGSLVKLSVSVGTFLAAAVNLKAEFVPVRVLDWKGQMSKEAVIARIKDRIPEISSMKPDSHCWDAIGIGLYVKGHFKARKPGEININDLC